MTTTPILETRGIRKAFGGVQAVEDGSIRLSQGGVLGLVGPNGCGKSTLLNVVAGFLKPDEGEVCVAGEPIALGSRRAAQRCGIALIPQEVSLADRETVWEAVSLGSEPTAGGVVRRRAARQLAADALKFLDVTIDPETAIASLGTVERRLVSVARALARPGVSILILDEPTAGLPADEARKVLAAMKRLLERSLSMILVSHHMDDLVDVCDSVAIMRNGSVVAELAGKDIARSRIVDLMVGDAPAAATEGIAPVATAGAATAAEAPADARTVAAFDNVMGAQLRGASLTVSRGEVVGVAGLLGSGAAEIVGLVTGQAHPLSGDVRVGVSQTRPRTPHNAMRAGVGFVSGDRAAQVIREMTVSEHVTLPSLASLSRLGITSKARERVWVDAALDLLSVKGSPHMPMTSLSGGNQQRALIARWVAASVDLLVADQPTVGVDVMGRQEILAILRTLARRCGVLLFAEPDDLAAACTRVVCLHRGVVTATLSGDEVTEANIVAAIA